MPDYIKGDRIGTATVRSVTRTKLPSPLPAPRGPASDWLPVPERTSEDTDHVSFLMYVKTVSVTNERDWRKRARLAKEQRMITGTFLMAYPDKLRLELAKGCHVTMTRLGRRKLDSDNLDGAMKSIRDAIAVWLYGGRVGQHDDRPEVDWKCLQIVDAAIANPGVIVSIGRRVG